MQTIRQPILNYQKLNYKSGGFLGRLLGPLLKTGLPLIKNISKPLAKRVLILLGLTAAASAADAGIHKKILGSGNNNNNNNNNKNNNNIKWWDEKNYWNSRISWRF